MEYHVVEITETLQKSVIVRGNAREALNLVQDVYYNRTLERELELTADDLVDTDFSVSTKAFENFEGTEEMEYTDGLWGIDPEDIPEDAFKRVLPEHVMAKMREVFTDSSKDTSKDDEINTCTNRELFDKWLAYQGIIGYSEQIMDMVYSLFGVYLE